MRVEDGFGFFMLAELVEEGNLFEYEVVALFDQFVMRAEQCEAVGMRTTQTLVELVKFHQDAVIGNIEGECFFHVSNGVLFLVAFVETS